MNELVIFCTDDEINNKILHYNKVHNINFEPIILTEESKCIAHVNYELPELCFYNFSDKNLDVYSILNRVIADPWLHYGGIIGLYSSREDKKKIDQIKNFNLISLIQRSRFDLNFPRLLRILKKNRQFLFQRHIQAQFLSNISGKFIIDNDPFDVLTYANMISNYLFNANYIDQPVTEQLIVALQELLLNAIEHGNCKISYEEKNAWLSKGRSMMDLIHKKKELPDVKDKKVFFEYTIRPEKSFFSIQDEGEGFDWAARKKKTQESNEIELHGRGIMMAEIYVSDLQYNEKGNKVSFEVIHRKDENLVPQVFTKQKEEVFEDGEVVFEKGEKSNFLYYIVSGKLSIISNGKKISYLTPADIFVGDMSFLLNNRRSVTVKSVGKTVLIKISKESFLNAIKTQPHYGIFLARLIAQRLNRLNKLSTQNKVD